MVRVFLDSILLVQLLSVPVFSLIFTNGEREIFEFSGRQFKNGHRMWGKCVQNLPERGWQVEPQGAQVCKAKVHLFLVLCRRLGKTTIPPPLPPNLQSCERWFMELNEITSAIGDSVHFRSPPPQLKNERNSFFSELLDLDFSQEQTALTAVFALPFSPGNYPHLLKLAVFLSRIWVQQVLAKEVQI